MLTTCPDDHRLPPVGRIRSTPRKKDDRLLALLALKSAGRSWPDAAGTAGFASWQSGQQMARCVRREDIEYSGEPEWIVEQGYW